MPRILCASIMNSLTVVILAHVCRMRSNSSRIIRRTCKCEYRNVSARARSSRYFSPIAFVFVVDASASVNSIFDFTQSWWRKIFPRTQESSHYVPLLHVHYLETACGLKRKGRSWRSDARRKMMTKQLRLLLWQPRSPQWRLKRTLGESNFDWSSRIIFVSITLFLISPGAARISTKWYNSFFIISRNYCLFWYITHIALATWKLAFFLVLFLVLRQTGPRGRWPRAQAQGSRAEEAGKARGG